MAAAGISDAAIVASPACGSMSTGRDSMDQGAPKARVVRLTSYHRG